MKKDPNDKFPDGPMEMFPDYEPKRTPDTVFDYGVRPDSKLEKIFGELGVNRGAIILNMELDKLPLALKYFKENEEEAKKNPGIYEDGNMVLGASPKQYVPSEEALIISELGKLIKGVIESTPKDKLEEYKKKEGINPQKLVYTEIIFTHVDAMGSGRFFYADKMDRETVLEL